MTNFRNWRLYRLLGPAPSTVKRSVGFGLDFITTVSIAAFTSITPPAIDPLICRIAHRVFISCRPGRVHHIAERIERVISPDRSMSSTSVYLPAARAYWLTRIEVRYGEARGAGLRPWTPDVSIEGLEHIRRSLRLGNGAILWRMSFTSATVVNSALTRAGLEVVHLSSTAHFDASRSMFSQHVAAPLYTRSEARWVERRIIRPETNNLAYLRELRDELLDNALVTIVGDLTLARHSEAHKVGNLRMKIPTGAPSLAHSTGASLHTCVAVRTGPFRYRLTIGPDIVEAKANPKSAARRRATAIYSAELERQLCTAPESAMWWGNR